MAPSAVTPTAAPTVLPSKQQSSTTTHSPENVKTQKDLLESLPSVNVSPLWAQMARLNPALPNPQTVPFLWPYEEIRPYLLHAGNLVREEQAERRVLMLVNPGRAAAPYTTDTLYAGLQLVMPRETAPAHRHSAFAVRFIIEGQGGFTAVHGRRVAMKPRDVLVTPPWNWHDHGKKGADEEGGDDKPVIWLDGLDLPEFVHFPVHFNVHYDQARYPAKDVGVDDSPIVFPWDEVEPKLLAAEGPWAAVPYLRKDGREIGRTIGALAERLDANASSPAIQETASSVYHIIEGTGHSVVGETTIHWKKGDTFAVPAWNKYQHFASGGERVFLYRFHDKPMLQALGFYRVEGADIESFADVW